MGKSMRSKKDKVPTITEEEYSQYIKAIQAASIPKQPATKMQSPKKG